MSVQGPWQIAAIGFFAATNAFTSSTAFGIPRSLSGFITPPGRSERVEVVRVRRIEVHVDGELPAPVGVLPALHLVLVGGDDLRLRARCLERLLGLLELGLLEAVGHQDRHALAVQLLRHQMLLSCSSGLRSTPHAGRRLRLASPARHARPHERPKRFGTFEEFWPHYVREHAHKSTRTLHFVGTSLAMACALGAVVLRRPSLLLLAPVVGYGPAWMGHFFIEKNRPATFTHPLFSLRADFVMWKKIVDGTMDAEVERAMRGASAEANAPPQGVARENLS